MAGMPHPDLPAQTDGLDAELLRRTSSPRLVLWLGESFDADMLQSMRDDLGRLPLIAVFSDCSSTDLEKTLNGLTNRIDPRYPVGVAAMETLEALSPGQLPIYYLGGNGAPNARQRRLRTAMLGDLGGLAEQRPIYVALGVTALHAVRDLMVELATDDPDAPLFLVGTSGVTVDEARVELAQPGADLHVAPLHCLASWPDFASWAQKNQIPLLLSGSGPRALVGKIRVSLAPILADPSLRLDESARFITEQALHAPPGVPSSVLFEAFMVPDERARARDMLADLDEWHAIDRRIPFERPLTSRRTAAVLKQLAELARLGLGERESICWLPAEPGAGASSLLHQIAHAAARAGYPTLVVTQQAAELDARQIRDFLIALRQAARAQALQAGHLDADPGEVPALLVLDRPHAGTEGLEELPRKLFRDKRPVVTLWALPVASGQAQVPAGTPAHDWYATQALFHRVRRPAQGDVFLDPLEASLGEDELQQLEHHARRLHEQLGIGAIEPRDAASWRQFQEKSRFRGASVIGDQDNAELVERFMAAEPLFWAGLFHFLTHRAVTDPFQVYRDAFQEVVRTLGADTVSLLLQVAKASAMGLPIPDSALRDHLSAAGARSDAGAAPASAASGASAVAAEAAQQHAVQLQEKVAQLRELWRGGRQPQPLKALDTYQRVRRLVDELERRNLVRSLPLNGYVLLRISHRAVAQALLVAATQADEDLGLLNLGDEVALCDRVLGRSRAYAGLTPLMRNLSLSTPNVRFCELLSLAQLQGTGEDSAGDWVEGGGEDRLQVYEEVLPKTIHEASRALLHHHANVLRYSVRASDADDGERQRRLARAEQLLLRALDQPWITGQKDEHPGHLLTTLGLVRLEQGRRSTDPAERGRLLQQGQQTLEDALAHAPGSRHTRLTLAESLLKSAQHLFALNGNPRLTQAASLASRVLQLLEIEPTGERERWYGAKRAAAALFGNEFGVLFLQRLQERGVEDGFLLAAEKCIHEGHDTLAIEFLQTITRGVGAARHVRSARRLAELYSRLPGYAEQFKERYRLLAAVEASGAAMTPDEDYQLACLEYQLGSPMRGSRRFANLRAGHRHQQVSIRPAVLLDDYAKPKVLTGVVGTMEGDRGWMKLRERGSREDLFSVTFFARHFGRVRAGATVDVVVRFDPRGPNAVPPKRLGDG